MISRLDRLQGRDIYENTALAKINELVDAVNAIQKERDAERFEIQEWIGILEAVRKSVNVHEKQIDELQMKLEPEKCEPAKPETSIPVAENVLRPAQPQLVMAPAPEKPDSDIIYKGE